MIDKTHKLLLWSLALLLLLTACGGAGPDFSNQEGVEVNIFAPLGRTVDAQDIETQGVPVDPETGETGVARAELAVFSSGTRLFFNDGRVVDEGEGESVTLTPDDSNVTLFLPEGTYRFELTAFDDQGNTLAQGEVEQRVSENSRVSVPLTSLIGAARFEVPESIKGNQVFDAFLRVSPPNRPDLEVALGDFDVTYEVKEPSVQLPGASNIGVRVAAACDAVEITATLNNDLSDTVSASASVPVVDEKCEGTGTDVGTDLVPPFIDIITPEADTTVNNDFTLQGDVNDQQSGIDRVEVYEGTLKLGEANIDSDAMTWSFDASLEDGRYTLIAVAFDKAGNSSRAEVNVKVQEGAGGGAENCTNPVNVPDQNLRRILENTLGLNQNANITCEVLAKLTELSYEEVFPDGTVPGDLPTITTLEGLQFAVNLNYLYLDAAIDNYDAVAGLSKLKTLQLSSVAASSLEPLRNLTALTDLSLSLDDGFLTEDEDALGGLINLERLFISGYGADDLTSVQNLTKLTELGLLGGSIGDLTPLQNLTQLRQLDLRSNQITDLSPLVEGEGANLPLTYVNLIGNPLETCFDTEGRKDIEALIARGVEVLFDEPENCGGDSDRAVDIPDPVLEAQLRTQLGKPEGPVTRGDLARLLLIYAYAVPGENEPLIENLEGLQYAVGLQSLSLNNNNVSDISPLVDNEGLGQGDTVDLSGNPLETCPGTDDRANIDTLIGRGVEVLFDEPENCDGNNGSDNQALNIPDEVLKGLLLRTLGKSEGENITKSDMESLSVVEFENYDEYEGPYIESLEGLQYATNLKELSLQFQKITDLSPLQNLDKLAALDVTFNDITDASPLAGLRALNTLTLTGNAVSDLSPLVNLENLTELSLSTTDNGDSGLSVLRELTNLKTLRIEPEDIINGEYRISDASFVSSLVNLEELYLRGNAISDAEPLRNLSKLKLLRLDYNPINNVSPLTNLPFGLELHLSSVDLDSFASLAELTNVTYLDVAFNDVADLSPLAGLEQLTGLDLQFNGVEDLAPLAGLTNLCYLDLGGNDGVIEDISPLVTISDNGGFKCPPSRINLPTSPASQETQDNIEILISRGIVVFPY